MRESAGEETFGVLDSFDWRFYRKGWLVREIADELILEELGSGRVLDRAPGAGLAYPLPADRLPASGFAVRARQVLAMRSLLYLGTLTRRWVQWELLNRDGKIVARLVRETYEPGSGQAAVGRCRLLPVRGYDKAARRVADALLALGWRECEEHPVPAALAAAGEAPGSYSSKVRVELGTDMATADAVRVILAHLVDVMHRNLPGLREDIDTEFLHDFRVAVRRSRSLLAQMKDVFDPETTARLRTHLKTVGGPTSRVRDLDVYLLRESDYVALVPPFLRPGVARLFRDLRRKRRRAFATMLRAVDAEPFTTALAELDRFVSAASERAVEGAQGRRPVRETAGAAIARRYRKIVKRGGRIGPDTPDERLHELRLECKKLRYLLEFFVSVFPPKEMGELIAQLKKLQDNLGELNDLKVQQEFLRERLLEGGDEAEAEPLTSGATGGLITQLAAVHREVRAGFLGVFDEFRSPRNRKRFRKLFG